MNLAVNPPKGFRVSRTEDKMASSVTYRVKIDHMVCVEISEEADLHADYVEETIRFAIRQLSFDVRDLIEESI